MDVQAIFGLQFVMSLVVWGLIAKWWLAPWLEKMSQHQALLYLTLPHAFRYMGMVFLSPRNRCATAAKRFRHTCRLRGLDYGSAGVADAHRSAEWLGMDVGAGLALQHCRHSGPSKRTAPTERGTEPRGGLVHPDIVRATTLGDSLHDFCPAAQTRALSQVVIGNLQ